MLDQGIPVATTNSFDPTIYMRDGISHTGQSAAAAAIGGAALAQCVLDKGLESGSTLFPSQTTAGNVEVNNRVVAAFDATVTALNDAGKLANFTVDAGPQKIGIAVNDQDIPGSIVHAARVARGRRRHIRAERRRDAGHRHRHRRISAFGYDLGPPILEGLRSVPTPARLVSSRSCRASGQSCSSLSANRPWHRGRQSRYPRPGRDAGERRDRRQALRDDASSEPGS